MSSTPVAENYHLKWDSHLFHMHISLANLLRDEKFADVMLLPSSSHNMSGILAHKFILSSCSSFFASIFDTNSAIKSTASGIVYIVLPPDLSRHAIKILVQYMYNGEATVPNDILNEVLRGGELLKIRGLCRNINDHNYNTNNSSSNCNSINSNSRNSHSNGNVVNNNGTNSSDLNKKLLDSGVDNQINATKCKEQQENNLKNSLSITLPKESPVIVRPAKRSYHQSSLHLSPQTVQPTTSISNTRKQIISVRKDVAIDPVEYHSSSKYRRQVSSKYRRQVSSNFEKESSQQSDCSEMNCFNCITSPTSSIESPLSIRESERIRPNSEGVYNSCPRSQSENLLEDQASCNNKLVSRNYGRRSSLPENENNTRHSSTLNMEDSNNISEPNLSLIKQEPPDWSLNQTSNSPLPNRTKIPPLAVIKTESSQSSQEQIRNEENDNSISYSPLTCDICRKTFPLQKDWVHHIRKHSDSVSTHVPPKKKRKPPQPDSELIATLRCDLCSTYYLTPAEWVRHTQSSHTENELAASNNEHSNSGKIIMEKSTTNNTDQKSKSGGRKNCNTKGI